MGNRWSAAAAVAAAVVVLAACGSSGPSSPSSLASSPAAAPSSATSAAGIKATSTGIGPVLTNARGFTLYWFALDTSAKSACNGACATLWPPLKGPASAAVGVSLPGKWGTIKRSDGTIQATYDGHPLYTYKSDTSPGQTKGNGLKLSGGVWHAMTPSGVMLMPAAKPSPMPTLKRAPSSSPSSGGYGY
jgi:predicted lipoprotein with Yx(FWY)xxD motif